MGKGRDKRKKNKKRQEKQKKSRAAQPKNYVPLAVRMREANIPEMTWDKAGELLDKMKEQAKREGKPVRIDSLGGME